MPRVSVVTPCYNGARFIANNIRSVAAQTFRDWEHIIVDDCSTDDSAEIIRQFPHVRLLRTEKNGGAARALNHGCRHAQGEILAWVSADDGYLPHHLEEALAFLDAHPTVVMVDAGAYIVDAEGYILRAANGGERPFLQPRDLLHTFPILGSSSVFRRQAFEQLGGFEPDMRGSQDADLWLRMRSLGDIGHVARVTTFSTRHPGQDSRTQPHIMTVDQKRLPDRAIALFGLDVLLPADWQGPREGARAEAAGWFALARSWALASPNPLVPEWVGRARRLDPGNLYFRVLGPLLPYLSATRVRLRQPLASLAIAWRAAQARRHDRNVHSIVSDWLTAHPMEGVTAR